MTQAELIANRDKPVRFRDCTLILKAAKGTRYPDGTIRIKCLLQDRKLKNSYVIARAEELKPI
jgi:hypothetical protein